MEVHIDSKMSVTTPKLANRFLGSAKENIENFFRHSPEKIEAVHFTAFAVRYGCDARRLLKVVAPIEAAKVQPDAVSILVHTEGSSHALEGLVSVPGIEAPRLLTLIKEGPYNRRVRSQTGEKKYAEAESVEVTPVAAAVIEAVEPPITTAVAEVANTLPVAVSYVTPPSIKPATEAVRLTPLQKLRAGGFPEDDIERLKATLSVILQEEMKRQGLVEVPNTLRVKVRDITAAIIDHMQLSRSLAGTYRGIVGAFYSSRITLFALKFDEQDKGDEMYADWLFDCDLVVDFIGGKDQLEALARVRRQEVREREAKEAAREPAPTASAVEEAVLQRGLTDEEAVALAHKWLEGREEAEQAVTLARENLASHEERLVRLLAQVEEAKLAVEGAKDLVKAAEKNFSAANLSEEVLTRLREAKERLVKLCSRFGI